MILGKYKNIKLTNQVSEANCITHSGRFHVDEVMATVFLSRINDEIVLLRTATMENLKSNGKLVYDIGLGEFDHHQKNRNGKRKNEIFYSSIGLLWKNFGKDYLKKIKVNNIDKTFEYIDSELIQNIDAADNMQFEYVENKISPDFVKLCNPRWDDETSESESFINAVKLGDAFWDVYIKNAISEIEATDIIVKKMKNCKNCYLILDKEMPYKQAMKYNDNQKIKYIILKSKREGYDIRIVKEDTLFKEELVNAKDIGESIHLSEIQDLTYVDNHSKLCCTKTLEGAIKLVKFNEKNI